MMWKYETGRLVRDKEYGKFTYLKELVQLGHEHGADRDATIGTLPDIVVIGAHKSGSSALFRALSRHGQIRPSLCKENHWLTSAEFKWLVSFMVGKGLGAAARRDRLRYRFRFFFRTQNRTLAEPAFLSLDGTPAYLSEGARVAKPLRHLVPDAHAVVVLRKPVDRAISHFANKRHRDFKGYKSCRHWFDVLARNFSQRCSHLRPVTLAKAPARRGVPPPVRSDLDESAAAATGSWEEQWDAYSECALSDPTNAIVRSIYGMSTCHSPTC